MIDPLLMKSIFWIYLLIMIAGLAVLAWPEENNIMMIQLSETHGPSGLDMIGIAIMMIGYIPMGIDVGKSSVMLRKKLGKKVWALLLTGISLSFLNIALALVLMNNTWLWTTVALTVILQGILVYLTFRNIRVS